MGRHLPIVSKRIWVCVSNNIRSHRLALVLTPGCSHDSPNIKENKQDPTFVVILPASSRRDNGIVLGDQLQKDVQHWLSPPNPSTNQNFVRKARHKGTAAWFFESSVLTGWKGKESLLWIHGKRTSSKPLTSPLF